MSSAGVITGEAMIALGVIATTALVSRVSPFYKRELNSGFGRRELPLDGLRGIAALMVVMHHAAMFRNWLVSGEWGNAGSPVLEALGPAGVHLFFMLTGYLFWSKARTAGGKLKIAKLWRGRLYRIGPLYLFSVILIVITALAIEGPHLFAAGNLKSLGRLLSLGLLPWKPFGDFDLGQINAGVVWTLWYEWRFYLVLPFIAWLALGRRVFLLGIGAYAAVFAGIFFLSFNMQPGLVFLLGMVCPVLLDNEKLREQLRTPAAAAIALGAAVLFGALNQAPLLSFPFAATLFPVFLVAAAGNSFRGVLIHPAIRCLGAVSYSLYLLHGILLFITMNTLKTAGLTTLPGPVYWLILVGTAMAAALLSAATYRWVEFPFLSQSHKKATTPVPQTDMQPVPESVP
jgi:peptidoglycan/LPS O-acetylase OafA/YrhL